MVWSCFFPIRPQYRTGKTLGSGTYAIVKEAVHIRTGKYYACKVINKKLMEGREYMVHSSSFLQPAPVPPHLCGGSSLAPLRIPFPRFSFASFPLGSQ